MRFDNRAVPIALAAVLIDTIGFGIVMPVFPKLITQLGHINLEQATRVAGYMLVVFSVMQFFAGPVLGNLSDRFGRRPILLTSMLCFGMDYALMAWAPTLGWLFLGRAIAGAAGAGLDRHFRELGWRPERRRRQHRLGKIEIEEVAGLVRRRQGASAREQ